MDIVHHTFIGGVGFIALAANEQELAGMAFVAGSVLPDLDVAFMVLGKRTYLKNHQGPTHSLILAPLYAYLFIALPLSLELGFDWTVFFAALMGLWLHSLMDLTNTFGITIFWPVSKTRYCFDAVFFIDIVAWCLTAFCYIAEIVLDLPYGVTIYTVLFTLYVAGKIALHKNVKEKLNCAFAVPSALNPFHYFILEEGDDGIKTYIYNVLGAKKIKEKFYPPVNEKFKALAEKSNVYKDMQRLAKFFYITSVEEQGDTVRLTLHDLGTRNFGGKFCKTILTFSQNGNLINEMAHI